MVFLSGRSFLAPRSKYWPRTAVMTMSALWWFSARTWSVLVATPLNTSTQGEKGGGCGGSGVTREGTSQFQKRETLDYQLWLV